MAHPTNLAATLAGSDIAQAAAPYAGPRLPIALPQEPLPSVEQVMAWAGFPAKYAGYRPDYRLEDKPSEKAIRDFLADLPARIAAGAWVYLLGAPGVGKTGVMVRIMHSLPLHRCPLPGPGHVAPAMVRYRLGSDMAGDLARWHRAQDEEGTGLPCDMTSNFDARVLFVDDLCRMGQIGGYQRETVLHMWDTFTEKRDGHWLTVVSANLTEQALGEVPQFARGLDRARESGLLLEIPGRSRRGRE